MMSTVKVQGLEAGDHSRGRPWERVTMRQGNHRRGPWSLESATVTLL